jgi:hypothetical protein
MILEGRVISVDEIGGENFQNYPSLIFKAAIHNGL